MTLMCGRNGVLAAGVTRFQNISVTDNGSGTVTVTFTTDISLATGRAGFFYGVNDSSCPLWVDAAGAAANQSIVVTAASLGATTADVVYVDVAYSLTDPVVNPTVTAVAASDYGIAVSSTTI